MKKKTLIFDLESTGHHLEYLNHLYIGAGSKLVEDFVFAVSEDFQNISSHLEWPLFVNVKFHFIKSSKIKSINGNIVKQSYYACKLISEVQNEVNANAIFLINLMQFSLFLSIFLNKKIQVSGIIYSVYLYKWKNFSTFRKIENIVKYLIISKSCVIKDAYILNDNASALILNKKYKTSKFKFLPDPVISISRNKIEGFREVVGIKNDVQIILHFGVLSIRKGTLEILKLISLLDSNLRSKFLFVFAGKVEFEIKNEFYKLFHELKNNSQIYLYDEFCSFEQIESFCISANYLLIPYKSTFSSSGVLGYGARFNIPIVGPNDGLVGRIIRRYRLGYTLKDSSAEAMLHFFINIDVNIQKKLIESEKYLFDNSISKFTKIILK